METNMQDSNNIIITNNSKKKYFIFGGIVAFLMIAAVITTMTLSQKKSTYDSEAQGRIFPTQAITRIPTNTVTPTITSGPINSEEGLTNALGELENANAQAVNTVQSHINELDTDSSP